MSTVQPSDEFVVHRNPSTYKVQADILMSKLEDTDWMPVNRGTTLYKISGADLKAELASGGGSPLSPSFPPFGGTTYLATNLSSPDNKLVFSLNGTSWSSSVSVPINTPYYVDWGTDILSATPDSPYSATIAVTYPDVNLTENITIDIKKIDKLPDQLSIADTADLPANAYCPAKILIPKGYNAPTSLWVSSNSGSVQAQIGRGGWFTVPTSPGSAHIGPNEELQVRHQTRPGSGDVTTSTFNLGFNATAGNFISFDLKTTNLVSSVHQPSITSPTNGSTGNGLYQFVITSSPYVGVGDAHTHASSDWQIATDAGFNSIVQQSMADATNKVSWTVNLPGSNTYYYRVRHNSTAGYVSEWSPTLSAAHEPRYFYRIIVNAKGGDGGNGGWGQPKPGGVGGTGSMRLETTRAFIPSAVPGSVSWTIGSAGQAAVGGGNAAGGGGSYSGGNGAHGSFNGGTPRSSSGGGGGATEVRLNSTMLLGIGGGGGGGGGDSGNNGNGGAGATLTLNSVAVSGSTGGNHDANAGGGGGSPGGGSNGASVSNGGTNAVGGAGGGGYGGGGGGQGNGWSGAGGGGGGASVAHAINGTIDSTWQVKETNSGNGSNTVVVWRALENTPTNWTQINTLTMSGSGNRSISAI